VARSYGLCLSRALSLVPSITHAHTQGAVRGNMFTHHQKTVIVDAPLEMVSGQQQQQQQGRPVSAPTGQQPRMERASSNILTRAGSVMRRARYVVGAVA
jgi:hypothetical protein